MTKMFWSVLIVTHKVSFIRNEIANSTVEKSVEHYVSDIADMYVEKLSPKNS